PSHVGTDRDARRLRARRVRRVHRSPRRRSGPVLPPARRAGRRRSDRDGRRARGERRPPSVAGVLSKASRVAVRLLHVRHPDGRGRSAREPRRDADAGRDRRHGLRASLPLHWVRADRRRDRGSGGELVNLARSLDYAAERHPEREAVVDGGVRLDYAELRGRAARLAGALVELGLERGERLAAVLRNRHETVSLYWAAQWLGATFVPLSWRSSPADLDYCIENSEARSHRADRAGGLSQVVQHGLDDGDRTLGAMPLYHTMSMHSLLAMSLIGGCFVVQERWDAAEA